MTDRLESLLLDSFKSHRASSEPGWDEFQDYLEGRLDEAAADEVERYIASHRWAQDFVLEARSILAGREAGEKPVPADWVLKAKALAPGTPVKPHCPHCGRHVAGVKKPAASQRWLQMLYLAVGISCFAFSFLVPRYFMQFLAVAVLSGVKWIVEHRAAKTQIMIYRALSAEEPSETHRLQGHSSRL